MKENKGYISTIKTIVYIVIAVSLIRVFFVQAFNIPSGSMKPTLLVGDFILVNKLVYGDWTFGIPFTGIDFYTYKNRIVKPDRGDIIVFKYPENPKIDFIKRIIALPGDTVEVKDDVVYINGKPLPKKKTGIYSEHGEDVPIYTECTIRKYHNNEKYCYTTMEIYENEGKDFGPIKVPEGQYFVMGDNRDNSRDSRFWGFVPDSYIIGRAFVVYFSIDLQKPMIRFNRIGKIIR
ncbi:signal peptidase I [Hydrogenivirga sp. 128-5-R1-1]|uniref:signal peptidase I n=1 Tax=Hydrogenivirga sp. 128-5-R1-1 TaxID=392423 RepID=UPI00015EF8AB|nr:signal peptidase I [Hydrogenivirga sp. 128-5-R1-1]EDP74432.1 signal peptidase I protein [Hydrogenivirga sp. 128-5-R1-1]